MTVDLSTGYLGLRLPHPIVVSACPLTGDIDQLRELEEAGAAAAVLPSLFEEQIEHNDLEVYRLYEYQTESYAESLTHFPELTGYNTGPSEYLRHIEKAKQAVSIPIIGSLNGCTDGGWTRYARLIEEAGADAIELNLYFIPTDPHETAMDVEQRYIDLVEAVRAAVQIPLAVKIGAHFSSLPNFAARLEHAGADGLVLFNRYLEPDIDLETLEIVPNLILSSRHEVRLPLRWIAILRDQRAFSLAATSGIHFAEDALKVILAGADVAMVAAAVLRYGTSCIGKLHSELLSWLETNEYESLEQAKGSLSQSNAPDPTALERANYMRALTSYTTD